MDNSRGKTTFFDSDTRANIILYLLISSILIVYSISGTIMWNKVISKPSQSVTSNEARWLMIGSIVISIFGCGSFIWSVYKLIIGREMRERLYNNFKIAMSKEAGLKPRLLDTDDIKNIPISKEGENKDIFAEQLDKGSLDPFAKKLNLEGF